MARVIRVLCLIILVAALSFNVINAVGNSGQDNERKPLEIISITPTGEDVAAARQITFKFNRPVVRVGRMERDASEIPIKIKPEVKGQWRWIDTSTLALMLDDENALSLATRYEITVKPGIKAEDGTTLKNNIEHTFITERPKVAGTEFKIWDSPGKPAMRIIFNQPVSKDSVEKYLIIRIKGQEEKRFPIDVKPDPDFEERFESSYYSEKSGLDKYLKLMGQIGKKDKFCWVVKGVEHRIIWVISPKNELPENSTIEYLVEPGLVSVFGPVKGIENRIIDTLDPFPSFNFIGFKCRNNRYADRLITQSDGENVCYPGIQTIGLVFTSRVFKKEVMDNITIEPGIKFNQMDFEEPYMISGEAKSREFFKFEVWLPDKFKPNTKYRIKSDSNKIVDIFGRTLDIPIDIQFSIPKLHRFNFYSGVLEKNADTEMPLFAAGLNRITVTYDKITASGKDSSLKHDIFISNGEDGEVAVPVHVRKMLDGNSGIVSAEVTDYSPPAEEIEELRKNYNFRNIGFSTQITPFNVHLKKSNHSSMVWVTDLATGNPVSGAKVELIDHEDSLNLSNKKVLDSGITDSEGVAILAGSRELNSIISDDQDNYRRLAVLVTKGDDIATLSGDFSFDRDKDINAWGTTSQGVYKPGDTIKYKIYIRDHNNMTFISAPKKGYTVLLRDPLRKIVFNAKDLVLSEFGALEGEIFIPESCVSGFYEFLLYNPFSKWPKRPMKVLVTDYSTSSFEITTDINKNCYHTGDTVKINTSVKLHNGDPYGDAAARVTAMLYESENPRYLFPENSPAWDFIFGIPKYRVISKLSNEILKQSEGTLDKKGNIVTSFNINKDVLFGNLTIESAVRDERGKFVTEVTTAKYSSRDRFVGLYSTSGKRCSGDVPCSTNILVVDINGEPINGIPVTVSVERMEMIPPESKPGVNLSNSSDWKKWKVLEKHNIESGSVPFKFSFIPKIGGLYRVTADIRDSKDREQRSSIDIYINNKHFNVRNDIILDELKIIPDQPDYKLGDTARYTVENPFPGAKALISIERNGIIKHWVQTLDTNKPIIEVKIERDFYPGYNLSVTVMSPGAFTPSTDDKPKYPKPSYRIGNVKTIVEGVNKKLDVKVKFLKEIYKTGEMVKVDLHVTKDNPRNNEPVELAVAVLNEEVFQLISQGKGYFDPHKGFYSDFSLGVENDDLLDTFHGWQYPGEFAEIRKKLLEISDGPFGAFSMSDGLDVLSGAEESSKRKTFKLRSNLQAVAYWNPSIIADKEGRASIDFVAPDNLTGWCIFAMAVTPTDQMGLGEGHFTVTQDTEIRSVMPNQVTEGDSFKAGFSIMNRTDKTRELTVNITAEGAIETDSGQTVKQITQTVTAEPNKRTTVWLPLKTKGSGKIKFTAKGGDATDQDGLVHELEVRKMVSLETAATYGTTVDKKATESLQFPEGIRTDVGNVKVALSPTVIGNVEGAFQYMRDYPYECWEQNLTKVVMASHYQNLKKYMPADFKWEGSDTLTQSMLDKAASLQTPNGGMAYYTPNDQYADPYLSAYTAIAFTWLAERGYKIPVDVQGKLNNYLSTMLKKEEISDFYSKGMASTVRAVALAALAKQGKIGIEDLKQYYPHVKDMDLFGKAHFLIAAIKIKGTEDMQKEVFNMILSHADRTGGKYVFSETVDSGYSRILSSSLRTNAAILSSLIAYGKTEQGKKIVGDIPFKIVRYITQTRRASGRWENTQEIIFCMNALVEFSQAYEAQKPDMTIIAKMDEETMGNAKFIDVRDKPVELLRPIKENDPGRKTAITIEREGEGRIYYSAGMAYAPVKPNREPINAGIDIKREYAVERNGEWILLNSPMEIKRGELVRIDLFVSIPAARNFLVVNDPVPGGLEPVNSDLATSSIVDAQKGEYKPAGGSWWFQHNNWSSYGISRWSFYHRELRHHAAIFYSEYLPAGNYHLLYTAQVIASGEFTVMPAHAEEMYDTDVFGKSGAGILKVKMEN